MSLQRDPARSKPGPGRPPGSRAGLWRAVFALLVVGGSLALALTTPARLGLDLRGGTQIVLETQDGEETKANAESTDRALEVLRRRVDALGVAEPTLARSGDRRIIVELPGLQDPREAAETIGRTAQLTFHPVLAVEQQVPEPPAKPADLKEGERILADEDGQPIRIGKSAMSGQAVTGADAGTDPTRGVDWFVTIDFNGPGGTTWRELTGKAACFPAGDPQRRVAIVLDEEVISSPQVDPSVQCEAGIPGGTTQITGQFSPKEAKDLAALIRGGALPVPVEVIEQRTVGPTLGQEAIDASIKAAIIGLALTALFITIVYRLLGFAATIALATYTLISYGVLVGLGATLTLPGLAGFVLAIGLAIDANVLVFERAREEYAETQQRGTTTRLQGALNAGFKNAWSAILDSNVTTLLAAGLLFFLAAGPVRGFGVTLSIGVIASMISALIVTRVIADFVLRRGLVQRHPRITGIAGVSRVRAWLSESGPNLARFANLFLAITAIILIVSFAGMFAKNLNLGVEFTGGRLLQFATEERVDVERARDAVAEAGFPDAVVQTSRDEAGGEEISIRTRPLTNEQAFQIEQALETLGGGVEKERDELLSASLGEELRIQAMIALAVALLAQLLYLAFRFRWTFGLAAVLSMFHDVVAVVGLFAWLGKPIDGVFLAAALTIIGISVNDSVVVFDRVREMRRLRPNDPFAAVANDAVLQTLPRTINTGLGAMMILAALAVLGGDSLTDVSIALLTGLVIGTWSTIATAVPLAAWFERRFPADGARATGADGGAPSKGGKKARPESVDPYAHVPSGHDA